jgi:cytochrome c peroxidase
MVFTPRDPGLTQAASGGGQIDTYTSGPATIDFLQSVNTFDPMNELEIKGAGATIGQTAFGVDGFNIPSLRSIAYTAPYFHDGSAPSLTDVFTRHQLGVGTIAAALSNQQETDLTAFLNSIDGTTVPFRSEADDFRDLAAGGVLP